MSDPSTHTTSDDGDRGRREPALVGAVVGGRFRVTGLLDSRGLGEIYTAHDEQGRVKVALKILGARWAVDPGAGSRIQMDLVRLSALQLPTLVDVVGTGRLEDGRPFIAMEWLEGADLRQVLGKQAVRLYPEESAHLLAGVAAALDAAHSLGVTHRTLSPSKILLGRDPHGRGVVKLLGFGIGTLIEAQELGTGRTRDLNPYSQPKYVAPEVDRQTGGDSRVDIYSLATIVFELLAGKTPFDAENLVGSLAEKQAGRPRSLREASGIPFPPAVEDVLRVGLAAEPAERYRTAGEFLTDVVRAAHGLDLRGPIANARLTKTKVLEIPRATSEEEMVDFLLTAPEGEGRGSVQTVPPPTTTGFPSPDARRSTPPVATSQTVAVEPAEQPQPEAAASADPAVDTEAAVSDGSPADPSAAAQPTAELAAGTEAPAAASDVAEEPPAPQPTLRTPKKTLQGMPTLPRRGVASAADVEPPAVQAAAEEPVLPPGAFAEHEPQDPAEDAAADVTATPQRQDAPPAPRPQRRQAATFALDAIRAGRGGDAAATQRSWRDVLLGLPQRTRALAALAAACVVTVLLSAAIVAWLSDGPDETDVAEAGSSQPQAVAAQPGDNSPAADPSDGEGTEDHGGGAAGAAGDPAQTAEASEPGEPVCPEARRLNRRGLASLERGQLARARRVFLEAIATCPDHPSAWLGLARVQDTRREHRAAVQSYRRYLDLSPDGEGATLARRNLERLERSER